LNFRYAKSPSLYAVELINEPLSPGVTLETLNKYYKAGYEAVRKHSSTAYVVLSNRLGPADPTELFPLAKGFELSVIDVHYYNLFQDVFDAMTVQQNIDFIYNNRSSQLATVTTSKGPLTFVGMYIYSFTFSHVFPTQHPSNYFDIGTLKKFLIYFKTSDILLNIIML